MQSLINKLFNGNEQPESEKLIERTPYERNAKLEESDKKETQLCKTLNEEQAKLFKEWKFLADGVWCDEMDLAYERGFKTGALLMTEVFDIKF